jgi:hypothetical protein
MSLKMAQKVIVPQKKIMSRSFLNSGTLIVKMLRRGCEVYLHSRVSASKTTLIWWIQNSMASWIRIWIHSSVITDPDPAPDSYY